MYRQTEHMQSSFSDFNQPIGLHMNPNNRWIHIADEIPWDIFEKRYAALFPSNTGNAAKPLRMALGSLIIQTRYQFSDLELVSQIQENPYYQYFIGLPGYQEEEPFEASVLVAFRKRLSPEIIAEANEHIINSKRTAESINSDEDDDNYDNNPDNLKSSCTGFLESQADECENNKGTLILDASCAPSNIKYPQDFQLLNDAREKLEAIIDSVCKDYSLPKPLQYVS